MNKPIDAPKADLPAAAKKETLNPGRAPRPNGKKPFPRFEVKDEPGRTPRPNGKVRKEK